MRTLAELDECLSARLVRMEITGASYEDAALLAEARAVRAGLVRAGAHAESAPSGGRSFRAALGTTLRGVYAWAFGALDDAFLHEHLRPVPKRLLRELDGHARVVALRAKMDPSLAGAEEILLELGRASSRLSRCW